MPWFRVTYDDGESGEHHGDNAEDLATNFPDCRSVKPIKPNAVPIDAIIEELQMMAESENAHGMLDVYDGIEEDLIEAGIGEKVRRAFWHQVHSHGGWWA